MFSEIWRRAVMAKKIYNFNKLYTSANLMLMPARAKKG